MANRQNGERNYLYIGLGGLLLGALLIVFAYSALPLQGCVGVVEISGPIVSSDADATLFSDGIKGSETIASEIESANERPDVKSVLVLIDSPGGSVVATREIYDALMAVNKSKVAYIHELGASGGYYVAAGTDYIMAHPDAITGSIGARMTLADMSGLFSKIGYNETSVKSGAMKDMGTPARTLTESEAAVLESIVNESFAEFRQAVIEGRGKRLDMPLFEQALDARIMTGRQAKKIGLVDETGNKKAAVRKAAELGGINDSEPSICELSKGGKRKGMLSSFSSEAVLSVLQKIGLPQLLYR